MDFFKVGASPPKKVVFICSNENSLKMMKSAFDKPLFVLKIFKL